MSASPHVQPAFRREFKSAFVRECTQLYRALGQRSTRLTASSPRMMGWLTGFEPAASASTVRRSNQLSYNHRPGAVGDPARGLWVAPSSPLRTYGAPGGNRTPISRLRRPLPYPLDHGRAMVGTTGFEPATSWSQTKRSTKLSYVPTRAPFGTVPPILLNHPRSLAVFRR
jgi:hypothetical protein